MSEMEEEDVPWDSGKSGSKSVALKTKRVFFSFSFESVVGKLGQRKTVVILSPKYFWPNEGESGKGVPFTSTSYFCKESLYQEQGR